MATPSKVDLKPVCKYGAKCYRKSEQHLKQYRHPKRTHEDTDEDSPEKTKTEEPPRRKKKTDQTPWNRTTDVKAPKAKTGTIEQYFGKKKPKDGEGKDEEASTSKSAVEEKTKSPEENAIQEDEPASDVNDSASDEDDDATEVPPSPVDVRENIKQKFLVEMPEDFYDFWKLCKKLNEEDPLEALRDNLGFTLVGPYDVLAGQHKDVEKNSSGRRPNFLLHWRYYYDPPEFLTVIKGDDDKQFHLGYFRDVPTEMPVFVAANSANDNGLITPRGENLFAAVNYYISETLKDKGLSGDKKKSLLKVQESLKAAASAGDYSLELKTKGMKERDKKVVTKTFHGAGLVVPVDENDVGYRPVPETPGDLKKMFTKIRDSKTEAERDKHMEPLQEIITYVQFANDECDYGEGLELGLDLFTFGGKCFHSPINCLLSLGYQLVGRPEFSKIIEAHLKRRSRSADLSQID